MLNLERLINSVRSRTGSRDRFEFSDGVFISPNGGISVDLTPEEIQEAKEYAQQLYSQEAAESKNDGRQ